MHLFHSADQPLPGDPEVDGDKSLLTDISSSSASSSGTTALTPTNSQSSTNTPVSTNGSGNGSKDRMNIRAIAGGTPRDLGSRIMIGSDLGYSAGFVGSVVLFTIIAVAVFLYIKLRRRKSSEQPEPQRPDPLDPHEPHRHSMYGSLITATPYVSLACGTELGVPSLPPFLESL